MLDSVLCKLYVIQEEYDFHDKNNTEKHLLV